VVAKKASEVGVGAGSWWWRSKALEVVTIVEEEVYLSPESRWLPEVVVIFEDKVEKWKRREEEVEKGKRRRRGKGGEVEEERKKVEKGKRRRGESGE
jgi:hypothetical protein